jgi:rhodanese-related sulfurtransferase
VRRTLTVLVVAAGLAVGLSACGDDAGPTEAAAGAIGAHDGSAASVVAADAVVIDVRTPEEFASGHLAGAVNIDVQAPDFDARIAELDPSAGYVVYCRSGNRADQAITRMAEVGFSDLTNGGSVQDASAATGLPVVTP